MEDETMTVDTHEADCEGFADERRRAEGWCKSYCASHHRCEPLREGDYLDCGECFHVFRTSDELVAAFMRDEPNDRVPPAAADIFFCPECLHDF